MTSQKSTRITGIGSALVDLLIHEEDAFLLNLGKEKGGMTLVTGKVLSVITPDAQRSMFTYLGASTELSPAAVSAEAFKDTAIAVIEGYLLFNRDLMKVCLESARAAGARIALDLASFEVVRASRDILEEWVREYVDILIANEDEAEAYTGTRDEAEALERLSGHAPMAVLKVGPRGSYVAHEGGDLWAAGFLYGIAHGLSLEKSGEIASACGSEVCRVIGAQIPEEGWDRIRRLL